ncbi:hypothetical protein Tco_0056844, partial [Tanacetum coccineum]
HELQELMEQLAVQVELGQEQEELAALGNPTYPQLIVQS